MIHDVLFPSMFAADEILKANMNLEKVQQELAAKMEKHNAIQTEVILTLEMV